MNTTKLSLLALLVVGCGGSMQIVTPPDGGSPDAGPVIGVSGVWSFHLVPYDRVLTTIPPPCDGTMYLTESAQSEPNTVNITGTWSCPSEPSGLIQGLRYPGDKVSLRFYTLDTTTGGDTWGGGLAAVTATRLDAAPDLTATRL
jgi:hypothetical protein